MTKQIFKYSVMMVVGHQFIKMHGRGNPIHFGNQNDQLFVWAEVDYEQDLILNEFYVLFTGDFVPEGTRYIGTTQVGPYVWHLYQKLDG